MQTKNPYSILGLSVGASLEDCRKRAKQLLKQHHPDNGGNMDKFLEVKDALKQIEDGSYIPKKHKRYLSHNSLFRFGVVETT